MFVLEVMLRLSKCCGADADAVLIAGFAGGFLGIAGLGTWRGSFFGAFICAFSAVLEITRAAIRSDDRIRALESSIEVCGTDLARLDMRFSELHDDSAVTATLRERMLAASRLGCRHSSGRGRRTKAALLLRLLGSTS